jgi:hypothetical protein
MFDLSPDSITRGLRRSSSRRPTAAETVAALKASLATEGKPGQWPAVQTLRLSDEDGTEVLGENYPDNADLSASEVQQLCLLFVNYSHEDKDLCSIK